MYKCHDIGALVGCPKVRARLLWGEGGQGGLWGRGGPRRPVVIYEGTAKNTLASRVFFGNSVAAEITSPGGSTRFLHTNFIFL